MTQLILLMLAQAPAPVTPQDIHRPRADPFFHLVDGGIALKVYEQSASGAASSVQVTDGTDTAQVTGTAGGALQVECVGGTCGSAAPFADDDAFTPGTTSVSNVGFEVDDTATTNATENSAGAARMTPQRSVHVNLRTGTSETGTAGSPLRTDPTGSTTQPISGTVSITNFDVALSTRLAESTFTGRFSAGALLSDNFANPTTTGVGAFTLLWDGAAWDRAPGSAADGLLVNLGANNDVSLNAGTNNIGDVDVLTLPALPAGTNNIGDVDVLTFPDNEPFNVAQINGVTPLMGNGVTGTGSQRVTIASDNTAFSVNIGTFPDNEPINVAQMNGVAVTMGNGAAGTGVQRVTLASDSTGTVAVTQATASSLNAEVQGDAAHAATISGNPIQLGAYAESDGAALDATGVAEGEITRLKADLNGRLFVDTGHPNRFRCQLNTTATALTAMGGSCAAPGASTSLYLGSVVMSASVASTTAADSLLQLKFGTGGSCGTGTGVLHQCFNTANGGCSVSFNPPIKVTANNEVCFMDALAGTKSITITGHIAP
jgi:hypothetical protein